MSDFTWHWRISPAGQLSWPFFTGIRRRIMNQKFRPGGAGTRRRALSALPGPVLALALASPAPAQNKLTLGGSIPSATHSFQGAIVFWANKAKKDLEQAHPGLQVVMKTASGGPEQANQLQDMLTAN